MVAVAHYQKNIFDMVAPERFSKNGDAWAEAVSAGNEALTAIENAKWRIGDLALCAIATYASRSRTGSDLLDEYARAINADPKHVRECLKVSKFWSPTHRAEMLAQRGMTYDHLRDAMKLGNITNAKKFLYTVARNGWSVEQARVQLARTLDKPSRPARKKTLVADATLIEATGSLYLFQIHPNPDTDSTPVQLSIGDVYKIAVFAEEN